MAAALVAVAVLALQPKRIEGRGVLGNCGVGFFVVRLADDDYGIVSLPYGMTFSSDRQAVLGADGAPIAHIGERVIVTGTRVDNFGDPAPCSFIRYMNVETIKSA